MARFIALIIIVIPIVCATIGVKLMRDTFYDSINSPFNSLWLQFISGVFLFIIGIAFLGGWIFYRDRKRHYVAKRFRQTNQNKRQDKDSK